MAALNCEQLQFPCPAEGTRDAAIPSGTRDAAIPSPEWLKEPPPWHPGHSALTCPGGYSTATPGSGTQLCSLYTI